MLLKISQYSQENTSVGVSFLIKLQALGLFIKEETPTQVISCEYCEIFKNTFLYTAHPVAAFCLSVMSQIFSLHLDSLS